MESLLGLFDVYAASSGQGRVVSTTHGWRGERSVGTATTCMPRGSERYIRMKEKDNDRKTIASLSRPHNLVAELGLVPGQFFPDVISSHFYSPLPCRATAPTFSLTPRNTFPPIMALLPTRLVGVTLTRTRIMPFATFS